MLLSSQKIMLNKYLAVLVDKTLSWKYHIDSITAKISKTIELTSKPRHSIPCQILLYIYQTWFHSHLNYGLAAWVRHHKLSLIKFSLFLQRKVLRIMYFHINICINGGTVYSSLALFMDFLVFKISSTAKLPAWTLRYSSFTVKLVWQAFTSAYSMLSIETCQVSGQV